MLFSLVGPFSVPGMSPKEPFYALGFCALWGIYGGDLLHERSKSAGTRRLPSQRDARVGFGNDWQEGRERQDGNSPALSSPILRLPATYSLVEGPRPHGIQILT